MMTFLQPDPARLGQEPGPAHAHAPPVAAFAAAAVVGLGALVGLHAATLPDATAARVTAMAAYGAAALATGVFLRRSYPHRTLGLCNLVTLARLVIVAFLATFLVAGIADPWLVVAFGLAALSLDGVDGWFARHERLASGFGARFDMEVDAAFALVLALLALAAGKAGAIVLVLGLARYAFVAATALAPWLAAPLPERVSRKAVCVLQIAALIALHLPFVVPPASNLVAAAVAVALVWSFGRDILWLRQRRS